MTRTLTSPATDTRPRGETLGARAVVAVTLASVVIAGCLYTGTELVLALLGKQPLIAAPSEVVRQVNQIAPAVPFPVILVVALVGTVLVLVAAASARRARDEIDSEGATVGDDEEVTAGQGSAGHSAAGQGSAVQGSAGQIITAASDRRVAPEPGLVPTRFTAAKAIADAIAYDSRRASRAPTPHHPTTDPTILTHPIEKKERTI